MKIQSSSTHPHADETIRPPQNISGASQPKKNSVAAFFQRADVAEASF